MLHAVLSTADATFLAALVVGIPAIIAAVVGIRNGRAVKGVTKELTSPNGGSFNERVSTQLGQIGERLSGIEGRLAHGEDRIARLEDRGDNGAG